MIKNIVSITIGIGLDYVIKDSTKVGRIIINIIAWSF